jgi:nucleoside-diphosphate-sugar epimerase
MPGEAINNVAIVFGASGISGSAALDVLGRPSSSFSRIIAVSRRHADLGYHNPRIHHVSIDMLKSPIDDIVAKLLQVGATVATHAFHYAYIGTDDEMEMVHVNKALLDKALRATAKVALNLKSFLLQTGYKYYGVHKGPPHIAPLPFKEDAKRHAGPNFYFDQEDMLRAFCTKHSWAYVITRPNFVIGVAKGNFMNLAVSIAIYAVLCKQRGTPFKFPGNQVSWAHEYDHSSAINNAEFQMWCSLNLDTTRNTAFNIHNGQCVSFKDLWPKIAKYFGVELPPDDQAFTIPEPKSGIAVQVNLSQDMPRQNDLWQEITFNHALDVKGLEYATWEFAEFAMGRTWWDQGDMTRARDAGWGATVDTFQSFSDTFDKMKALHMIPS